MIKVHELRKDSYRVMVSGETIQQLKEIADDDGNSVSDVLQIMITDTINEYHEEL